MNIFERNAKKVAIMAVIAASFAAIFVKLVNAPAMAIGFYRLSFALPFFVILVFTRNRKELFSISLKDLGGCILAGVFMACHFFSWFTALVHTTVASATVICMTHPIIILAITVLIFKEKTSSKAVVGVMIAFVGAAIISGGDYSVSGENIFGDIMAFMGAVFMALYYLTGRKYRKNVNASVYVFLVFLTSWIVFTAGMIATGTPFTGYSKMDYVWLFVMAMVCQIGAHAVFNWCLAYVSPLYLATSETAESVIASALAVAIFAEIPTFWQIVGGVITIGGLLYYNYQELKYQEEYNHNIEEIEHE